MRIKLYKRIFIVVSYLIFFICLINSDIDNWIVAIIVLAVYSLCLHYCYAYIFKVDMELHTLTLTLEDKYYRIWIFLCGASMVLSILFSMLGFVDILDFQAISQL